MGLALQAFGQLQALQAKLAEQRELPRIASRADLINAAAVQQAGQQLPQLPACRSASPPPGAHA